MGESCDELKNDPRSSGDDNTTKSFKKKILLLPVTQNNHVLMDAYKSSWWFQPIWKILVKLDHFPRKGVKIKNIWNHHLEKHPFFMYNDLMNVIQVIADHFHSWIWIGYHRSTVPSERNVSPTWYQHVHQENKTLKNSRLCKPYVYNYIYIFNSKNNYICHFVICGLSSQ